MGERDERYKSVRQIGLYTSIPFILLFAPLIGFYLGKVLDGWLHTGSVLRYVFLALGLVAAVRETVQIIRKASRE